MFPGEVQGQGYIGQGLGIADALAGRTLALTNCTLNANGSYGVYSATSGGAAGTVTITNSIVTNQSWGVVRGDASTGWSMAWKACFWARLHDGDHAEESL